MANVTLHNISKRYDQHHALKNVNLAIADREFVVFVGPSGCGKSTLLRMIAGLIEPSEGQVFIDDRPMNGVAPADRGIAMVFQTYALFPHMSVFDNIGFGLKMAGLRRADIALRVGEAARMLQIEPLFARKPRELSGGQRQRVAIGRAIVRHPKVFLFDEPLSNLDATLRVATRVEIARLHHEVNATVVYVTHDQVEAMTLASRIVVMRDGVVEQVGSPLEVYHRPANLFVAGFIGSPRMNFLPATVTAIARDSVTVAVRTGAEVVVSCCVDAAIAVHDALTLGVRPQNMRIATATLGLSGTVFAVERLGDESFLYVDLERSEQVIVKVDGGSPAKVGDQVAVAADGAACHLFDIHGVALDRRAEAPATVPSVIPQEVNHG
jgi:multiple sugar transport system ATP-binding protein